MIYHLNVGMGNSDVTPEIALLTLLHLLVLVYWLGGDLGAFYSSRFLTGPGISAERRFLAAKIVNDVDMAPRTALILAFPTGLLLAIYKHWLAWPTWLGWIILAASVLWLGLAWKLHLSHNGAGSAGKTIDLVIRYSAIAALVTLGCAGLIGQVSMPLFISLKCLLLAGAILMGLLIRRVLVPLGPALAGLNGEHAEQSALALAKTLKTARPLVMVIWALILIAGFLGIWTPT